MGLFSSLFGSSTWFDELPGHLKEMSPELRHELEELRNRLPLLHSTFSQVVVNSRFGTKMALRAVFGHMKKEGTTETDLELAGNVLIDRIMKEAAALKSLGGKADPRAVAATNALISNLPSLLDQCTGLKYVEDLVVKLGEARDAYRDNLGAIAQVDAVVARHGV